MKTRLVFVNGIWQLCIVAAAFLQERAKHPEAKYQDYLVLYSRKTANTKLVEFVETICDAFWNWDGAVRVDWTTADWNPQQNKANYPPVQQILQSFHLNSPAIVDEVWLCKIQFRDERLCADIFSKAAIVIYEDGLHTYAPTHYLVDSPPIDWSNLKKTLAGYKHLFGEVLSQRIDWQHEGVKRSHLRRIKKVYSVLGTQIPIPPTLQKVPIEFVEPDLLRSFFVDLNHRLQCESRLADTPSNSKTALLLGSNLSHLQSFPREREVEVFADTIRRLNEQGYTILWKEHPRNQKPLFEDIQEIVELDNFVYLSNEQKLPIEVIVAESNIDLCGSTLSSSLFYMKQIFGIRTVTCVRPLLDFLKGDFRQLSELTLSIIEEAV